MVKCSKCKSNTIWQSDFDAEDIIDVEQMPEAEESIISIYYCPNCDSMEYLLYTGEDTIVLQDI